MNELVKHQPPQSTLPERMNYARALAESGLLPQAYRKQPANVLYAVEYGSALGVPPMTAIMGIHVIQGKPTLSADLMAALIRRAGHKLRIRVESGPVAVAQVIRADDPGFTYECRWDMERARTAGLLDKGTWQQHPTAMLKARAISEVAREACSEVLNGLIYTPEELGAIVDDGGNAVDVVTGEIHHPPQTGGGADPDSEQAGVGSPPAAGETQEPPAPPSHGPDDVISGKQRSLLWKLLKDRGLTERADALAWISDRLGRDVDSTNNLCKCEASDLIDALNKDTVQEKEPPAEDIVDAESVPEQQELA